ncbi:AraC family transcriptional regulator [Clostridium tertium]|uniref:AraC family transcriptional regulator n=1 Tax=Clostridium TaxID=1485 RepID=UPI00232B01D6|nr:MULTISPECIES: AraC family transcriptional regulator [Clostridium]MDB1922096.1 AraC family transcriptional regulator [Clostridium tertium]MDB1926499.1 AraC family transcriptional regulator [Clostridium tertium]MDB1929692.1 AraC family transcriptional regulator [Clostridium tertium]MDU3548761.1 AraC family transcriptional regulator [Clostridium sp.]MDU4737265.1 AraC family transcriptional regulator [Clostridium sp.]
MCYINSIKKALNYIENNLQEDIDLSAIAKEAGYSLYHFHRIFKGIVGDSMKDYVRKRRFTEAAKELVYTNKSIVEIGIKYGYESREGFSRAFEKVYGRNPSEVRRDNLLYFIREPINIDYMMFQLKLTTEGLTPLYRNLSERYVVGKKWKVKADGSNLQDIPLLWQKWNNEKESEKIINRKCADEIMGICIFSQGDAFDYMIGHEVNTIEYVPEDMVIYRLEPSLYAVFRVIGPITESVQKTWDYIYSVWLSESKYKHRNIDDIEYYYYTEGELVADLYIPIIPY